MRRYILFGMIGVLACAPAAAVAPGSLGRVAPDERYEIFATTGRWTADSVKVLNDTLFARGIAVHPAEPRTPIALPILSVDSLRPAHTDRSALTSTLVPAAVIAAIGVAMNLAWGSD